MISWPIARATIRERLQPWPLATIFSWALVAAFTRAAFTGPAKAWVLLTTLVLGGGLIGSEVDGGHAQLVMLRPITRAAFVGGRLAGAAAVLAGAGVLAWIAAFVRGGSEIPYGLLAALAWLATLAAVSTVTRGWTNVAWVLAAVVGWALAATVAPLLTQNATVLSAIGAISAHFGPQDPASGRAEVLLWDGLWLSGAWLCAVLLFRDRELARRRA